MNQLKLSFIKQQFAHIELDGAYELVQKAATFAPEALMLRDENKQPIFMVAASKNGVSSLNKNGLTVAKNSNIAIKFDKPTKKETVEAEYGLALVRANKVLLQIAAAVEAAAASFEGLIEVPTDEQPAATATEAEGTGE